MLLSQGPSSHVCSFDTTLTCLKHLTNICSWEKDRVSTDFGGWVVSGPRKRKNRSKEHLGLDLETRNKGEKVSGKLSGQTSNIYYKRYRVDPLEGTFKHYNNIEQYMQLYRETTTLCFKQKTLNELTAMYSTALDINSDKRHTMNGYTYNLDAEAVSKWDASNQLDECLNFPPITSRIEGGMPLMLLPTAPSIPHRLQSNHSNQQPVQCPIAQASFMCNAYMNRNIVCPVHRVIHRKSGILLNHSRFKTQITEPSTTHIKVTLPGIPKRSKDTPSGSIPELSRSSTSIIRDEGEEEADARINQLLSTAQSFSNPCERISKVLQQQQQQRRPVPSMQLPVTALLQYNPDTNIITKARHVKKPLSLRSRHSRVLLAKKKSEEPPKPKPEVKQLMNYEKEYERFLSDVLESKGRSSQRKHFQKMCNNRLEGKKSSS
ncbi:hypothetical protein ACHWQZ_G005244 [Mnemiopsis leidyi]